MRRVTKEERRIVGDILDILDELQETTGGFPELDAWAQARTTGGRSRATKAIGGRSMDPQGDDSDFAKALSGLVGNLSKLSKRAAENDDKLMEILRQMNVFEDPVAKRWRPATVAKGMSTSDGIERIGKSDAAQRSLARFFEMANASDEWGGA